MQSVYSVLVTSITGALVGVAAMYVVAVKEPAAPAACRNDQDQLAGVIERMNRTETLLREIKVDIAANSYAQQELTVAFSEGFHESSTNTETIEEYPAPEELVATDKAVEDAVVQNIVMRLHDPDYTRSTTLPEVMVSEEMIQLSDQSRERVIAEMIGMLNRGDIDAATFLPGRAE